MRRLLTASGRCVPCVAFALGASALAFLAYGSSAALPEHIVANVYVSEVAVGGMTCTEAFDAVSALAARRLDETIAVEGSGKTFEISLRELGGEADVREAVEKAALVGRRGDLSGSLRETVEVVRNPVTIALPLTFREEVARAALAGFGESLRQSPQNATADIEGTNLTIRPHKVGVEPDLEATVAAVSGAARAGERGPVAFAVREVQPAVLSRDLEGLIVLGSFSTTFPTGQTNRVANIRLGSSVLDGSVIAPGEVFSLNQRMGPRTVEKGYRVAPVFSGQQTVLGVGGGICQIATTVYNAVLAGDLTVVERHAHSKPVHYIAPGRDATLDYGSADLRFQNSTSAPVILRVRVEGGTITAVVLGRKA